MCQVTPREGEINLAAMSVNRQSETTNLDLGQFDLLFLWYGSIHFKRSLLVHIVRSAWANLWFAKGARQLEVDKKLSEFTPLLEVRKRQIDVTTAEADAAMECVTSSTHSSSPDAGNIHTRHLRPHAHRPRLGCEVWRDVSDMLLFDQIPRNVYRGSKRAYAYDYLGVAIARRLSGEMFEGFTHLPDHAVYSIIICLIHSERIEDHDKAARLFAFTLSRKSANELTDALVVILREHRERILLFGRYPERSLFLGRHRTPKEDAYIKAIYAS